MRQIGDMLSYFKMYKNMKTLLLGTLNLAESTPKKNFGSRFSYFLLDF